MQHAEGKTEGREGAFWQQEAAELQELLALVEGGEEHVKWPRTTPAEHHVPDEEHAFARAPANSVEVS